MLFLNLGGEMMYILDQRLRAQNIPKEKSKKGKLLFLGDFLPPTQSAGLDQAIHLLLDVTFT